MGYLKAEAEIRPKGNFFVVDTEYVGHNGSDLKSIISAIQTAESSASTAISGLDTRITANTTSISGLDTRVTALEESGGGGGGGTTNYNELSNIPQINGVNLKGNLSASDLSIATLNIVNVRFNNVYMSSGTIGTRGALANIDLTSYLSDGKSVISVNLVAIGDTTTNVHPYTYMHNKTLYLALFRTTTSERSISYIDVRVVIADKYNETNLTK